MSGSRDGCGALYVCGTPIGNLKDASFRLVEVLGAVDVIACEDTRRTLKLLSHFGIKKPVISVHEHVERERTEKLLALLGDGKNVALVSDAGMPAVSDPGAYLIRAAKERGFTVAVVPGPSAVTAALAISGVDARRFVFAGFPPRKRKDRCEYFREFILPDVPVVFFEAPHRLKDSLADLEACFPDIWVCLCHELTKVHESTFQGPINRVQQMLSDISPQGEWVIVSLLSGEKQDDAQCS